MRTSIKAGLLTVGLLALAGNAKTPATLIQQFDAALPSGTEARMVWGQGANGATNELWCIDSRDGIARKIDVGAKNVMNPQMTYDATRIVFEDQKVNKVYVVNWDGSGLTAGIAGTDRIEDYWKDPASSNEFVVMYQGGAGYTKVNIATGASTTTGICQGGDDGLRLSVDGTKMAIFSNAGAPSIVNASGCAQFKKENCSDCGCIINISPDNNYTIMRQISGHQNLSVTASSTTTLTILVSGAGGILAVNTASNSCNGSGKEFEQTRWVHPQVITFFMSGLAANPYLFNISTKNWVSIQDDACFPDGQSADAIVSASLPGPTRTAQMQRTASTVIGSLSTDAQAYSINGRLIKNADVLRDKSSLRGVFISQSSNGRVSKSCR